MRGGLSEELHLRGARLRDRLVAIMKRGVGAPLPDEAFNELALEVFRFQAEAVPAYGAFVHGRGFDPSEVDHWSRIPPVPTRAFKELPLVAGDPAAVEAVFRTSGTTGGAERRGEHLVRDLSLYRAGLLPNARAHLDPAGEVRRVLPLLPPPAERPDSSLVYMAGALLEAWDDGAGAFLADADWHLQEDSARVAFARAERDGVPVLLLGTAFGLVHLLDRFRAEDRSVRLPSGSRVMETGGFKGRSREVSRGDLHREIHDVLGVPSERIVNEYGMTELLSQFYEPVLRGREADREAEALSARASPAGRHLVGPPWVRTRVLDPERLHPLGPHEPGLLCHLDLANLYGISAVLTEDRGVGDGDGFRVLGRTEGAEPRGCSLTMEEFLRSSGGGGR